MAAIRNHAGNAVGAARGNRSRFRRGATQREICVSLPGGRLLPCRQQSGPVGHVGPRHPARGRWSPRRSSRPTVEEIKEVLLQATAQLGADGGRDGVKGSPEGASTPSSGARCLTTRRPSVRPSAPRRTGGQRQAHSHHVDFYPLDDRARAKTSFGILAQVLSPFGSARAVRRAYPTSSTRWPRKSWRTFRLALLIRSE